MHYRCGERKKKQKKTKNAEKSGKHIRIRLIGGCVNQLRENITKAQSTRSQDAVPNDAILRNAAPVNVA